MEKIDREKIKFLLSVDFENDEVVAYEVEALMDKVDEVVKWVNEHEKGAGGSGRGGT